MAAKPQVNVEEAAYLTRRSTATIYRWIRDGKLRAEDTTAGPEIRTEQLLEVAGNVRMGRPRVGSQ